MIMDHEYRSINHVGARVW